MNMRDDKKVDNFLWETAQQFTEDKVKIRKSWQEAQRAQQLHEMRLLDPGDVFLSDEMIDDGNITILLLGHDYNLYDDYINMCIKDKLKKLGCNIVTPNQVSKHAQKQAVKSLPKKIFWTFGETLLGTTYYFSTLPRKKGVIILTSFGCGIDSIIFNMAARHLVKNKIPYLNITLDEHTGEAGLATRVEAFVDLLRWKNENYKYDSQYINLGTE